MERFANFVQRRDRPRPVSAASLHDLDALEEALQGDGDLLAAALEVGASAAASGSAWSELLTDVEILCVRVTGEVPPYAMLRELSIAWTETSLQALHAQSCEDPLTGLASATHLHTRIRELIRQSERDGRQHADLGALVVVEHPRILLDDAAGLLTSLAMLETAEAVRSVFDAAQTVARLGERRIVVLADRDATLAPAMRALRLLLDEGPNQTPGSIRLWVEGVPRSHRAASQLLSELAR